MSSFPCRHGYLMNNAASKYQWCYILIYILFLATMDTCMNNAASKYQLCYISHCTFYAYLFHDIMDTLWLMQGVSINEFSLHHNMPTYSLSPWILVWAVGKYHWCYISHCKLSCLIIPCHHGCLINNAGSKYQWCYISHCTLSCLLIPCHHGYLYDQFRK